MVPRFFTLPDVAETLNISMSQARALVTSGELPAIGPAAALDRRPVALPVAAPVPAVLRPAAVVDVWASARDPAAGSTTFSAPVRLAHNVEIYAVTSDSSALGATRGASVQVLLAESQVSAVLDALANGARLAIVPIPAGGPG